MFGRVMDHHSPRAWDGDGKTLCPGQGCRDLTGRLDLGPFQLGYMRCARSLDRACEDLLKQDRVVHIRTGLWRFRDLTFQGLSFG